MINNFKKTILEKYPDAKNIHLGNNNVCFGYWFQLPNKKTRNFKPLNSF
jgi:hypothetical protein